MSHLGTGKEIIGIANLFRESAVLPLFEYEATSAGLVLRDVGIEGLLLFGDIPRPPGFLDDRLPIDLGKDGHERQAKLPPSQSGFLLEVYFQAVGAYGLCVVEIFWVNNGGPVSSEAQF